MTVPGNPCLLLGYKENGTAVDNGTAKKAARQKIRINNETKRKRKEVPQGWVVFPIFSSFGTHQTQSELPELKIVERRRSNHPKHATGYSLMAVTRP
jgi:hypothetical protein